MEFVFFISSTSVRGAKLSEMYYNIVRKLVRNKPSDFKDSLSQLFESISTEKEDLPTDRVSYSSGHEFGLELKQKKKEGKKKETGAPSPRRAAAWRARGAARPVRRGGRSLV